jgi:hypothetical protein
VVDEGVGAQIEFQGPIRALAALLQTNLKTPGEIGATATRAVQVAVPNSELLAIHIELTPNSIPRRHYLTKCR